MKNIFRLFAVAVISLCFMGLTACKKEKTEPVTPGTNPGEELYYETLVGTEWEGTYQTTTQTQYGAYPVTIHWTVDFLQDGNGEVMFWMESSAFDPDQYSYTFNYTYDGKNAGEITDADGQWPFTCDPYNRTMQVTLQFQTQHVEDGPLYTYGGPTTLHQVR